MTNMNTKRNKAKGAARRALRTARLAALAVERCDEADVECFTEEILGAFRALLRVATKLGLTAAANGARGVIALMKDFLARLCDRANRERDVSLATHRQPMLDLIIPALDKVQAAIA